jgi:glycosyltransferase involved in cell wall biosynthesis
MELVFQDVSRFDILHFHTDYLHLPFLRRHVCASVTTLHGMVHLPDQGELFEEYDDVPLVSISDSQRRPLPWANWQATVYHGLPSSLHTFRGRPGNYLAFLGRASREKGLDRAIAIARRCGLKPFGLAMIEALACGTPVIAFRNGSVPEILDDGVTGFIVDSVEEAVRAVGRIPELSRHACRAVFEERFDAARMARDYLEVYRRLVHGGAVLGRRAAHSQPGGGGSGRRSAALTPRRRCRRQRPTARRRCPHHSSEVIEPTS